MYSESQWRYRAYRMGFRLVKYKTASSAYQQYGPYALVDRATNKVRVIGLDAAAVEQALFASQDAPA